MSAPDPQPDPQSDPRSESAAPGLVEELVFRCLESDDRHATAEALCREHPDLAPRLRRVLARLESEQLVEESLPTGGEGSFADDSDVPERLGEFRIVSRLGAGGMGVVYLAEDEKLGRQVAVKLVRPEHLYFPGARIRFQREIEAIARLHHPGIVTIHTVGEERGMPFFAMDYVRGISLAQLIADLAGTEPARLREQDLQDRLAAVTPATGSTTAHGSWTRAVIELVRAVADALHHAHERGVVHRDVKPSNILIGRDLRPRLLDFGLARADDAQQITRSTSQLGSLPYMAPELFAGGASKPEPALDVYALGVTMYELLTLRSPYLGATADGTRANIIAAAPVPPRTLNPTISSELETVCRTAMDPSPARRYGDMAALIVDLDNLAARRPIQARAAGVALRSWRWCQRHQAAAVGLVMAAVMFVLLAVFAWYQVRVSRAAESNNYVLGLLAAAAQLEESRTLEAHESLAMCPPHLRRFEWYFLDLVAEAQDAVYRGHSGRVRAVVYHPDGAEFASAGEDGTVRLWRLDTASPVRTLEVGADIQANGCIYTPDGSYLFAACSDGRVLRWRRDGSEETVVREGGDSPVLHLATDRSGRQAWGLQNGEALLVELDPDTALVVGEPRRVELQRQERSATSRFGNYQWPVQGLAFGPAGQRLYVAALRHVAIVDVAGAREIASLDHDAGELVTMVIALPDGERVLTGTTYGRLRLWHANRREVVAASDPSLTMGINDGVFDSERGAVWAAGGLGPVVVHQVEDLQLLFRRLGHEGSVTDMAQAPDGSSLLTASYDETIRRWDKETSNAVAVLGRHEGVVRTLEVTPDNRFAITGGKDGRLWRWDLSGGEPQLLATVAAPGILQTSMTPDGSRLLAIADKALVFELGSEARWREIALPERVRDAAWLRDGSAFVVATTSGRLLVLDGSSGAVLAENPTLAAESGDQPLHLVVCPWNGAIVTASESGALMTWDPAKLTLRRRSEGPAERVQALAADPSAGVVIAVDRYGRFRFWEPSSGRSARPDLLWKNEVVSSIDVSRDGHRMITSTMGIQIQVWDRVDLRKLLLLRGHHSLAITAARFTPDGRKVVSVGMDGAVRVYRSTPR